MAALVILLEIWFGEMDFVGTDKHVIYKLYQANKNLKVFLNTFYVLAKKTRFDNK